MLSRKRLDYYKLRLERATTTREESSDLQVAMQQWSTESAKLAGLEQQLKQLNITAPFAATVTDIATGLHAKRWLNTEQALATLVAPGAVMVQSLADAEAVAVLALAQTGKFIADDGVSTAIPVTVTEIDKVNVHALDSPYFASIYDGQTAVQTDPEHRLIPTQSVFAVRLKPDLLDPPKHIQRGIAVINAKPRSFIQRVFDITAAVLIRESGF
ncbi:HlyD family efflux transporter periplasmic adaptor subunit [Methylocucumis oryzae]|uniref:HlyD family efflux transporter periplasmic adaptor subunit n=1 Tax=Methylocucumis oryzae TaxID=1632867 RepID=UPI000698F13F|nr:HlyD family efflux transporter periplasmic adaptor subunit [Methylocucumis oryzae]